VNNIGAMAAKAANQGKYGSAPPDVVSAIRQASFRTGVDFSYLMAKAAQESSFDTQAKARTSSATGLYQFIDSTWLGVVKTHGAAHGFGKFADQIKQTGSGEYHVADPAMRRQILDLRKDANAAAAMAAEFASDNKTHLEREVGGKIGSTELYMAHFLGAGGASKFLNAMKKDPNQSAAALFPDAAAANQNVFKGRTLQQVFDKFAAKFDQEFKAEALTPKAELSASLFRAAGSGSPATGIPQGVPQAGQRLSLFTMLMLSSLDTPMDKEGGKTPRLGKPVNEMRGMVAPKAATLATQTGAAI
jgi:Transglycosylase SLT domain